MEKRRFRLRWDSSPGLSIAARLLHPAIERQEYYVFRAVYKFKSVELFPFIYY